MKRLFIMISMIVAMAGNAIAQSMSDDQVISFVVKEQQKGTSQSQIVTKLMQQGVTIEQIRKVRQKVERQKKNQGLGTQDITGESNRLRENNTSTSNQTISPYRIKDGNYTRHTYDANDQEYMLMQNELNDFMPDSTTMAEQAMYRRLADNQISNRNKVFGRDIFNNPRLNFEPNMNIATPQNYRLGPGDAVYVDIYGASQKTIESTITG